MDYKQLLNELHRGGKYAYFWTLPDRRTVWYNAAQIPEVPNGRRNIYFGVHPVNEIPATNAQGKTTAPEHLRARVNDIAVINALFAEFDAKDYGDKAAIRAHLAALPAPSVLIDSGGGYHAYWLLRETLSLDTAPSRARAIDLQRRWVGFVGGDKAAKDLARVLRVPGTVNYKEKYAPDFPRVTVIEHRDLRYDLAELIQHLPPKKERPRTTAAPHSPQSPLDDISKAAEALKRLNPARADDYEKWIDVGLALSNLGTAGLDLWDRWSSQSAKYEAGDCERKWNSFKPHSITIASLFHWANEDDPRPRFSAPAPSPDAPQEKREAETAAFLLNQKTDDEGNAQCFLQLYPQRFVYTDAYGWLRYTGKYWERAGAEAKLDRAIVAMFRRRIDLANKAGRDALIKPIAARTVSNCKTMLKSIVWTDVDQFDKDKDVLNCANGAVHLPTATLTPHKPEQFFTYCLPVPYRSRADARTWENWLRETVQDSVDMLNYIQIALGYSLTGHTSEECLFYLYGPTRSGKGTFTETILKMLGERLSTEVDFSTFTAARDGDSQNFDLAGLKACRFVAASETNKYQALNPRRVKAATGGNAIRAAFKRQDLFTYFPQFKIWLAANEEVNADPDDDALWGRVKVIHFPVSHYGHEDKNLKREMLKRENLEGVLKWAIQGAVMWYESLPAGLRTPPEIQSEIDAHRAERDTVAQFLMENCEDVRETRANAFIPNSVFYPAYETWCKENGHTPKKQRSLTRSLKKKGYECGRAYVNSERHRGIFGLTLRNYISEDPDDAREQEEIPF